MRGFGTERHAKTLQESVTVSLTAGLHTHTHALLRQPRAARSALATLNTSVLLDRIKAQCCAGAFRGRPDCSTTDATNYLDAVCTRLAVYDYLRTQVVIICLSWT